MAADGLKQCGTCFALSVLSYFAVQELLMQANDSNISLYGKGCACAKVSILPLRFELSFSCRRIIVDCFLYRMAQ